MIRSRHVKSADELVRVYEEATSERRYVPESFSAYPAGVDNTGTKMTLVVWRWRSEPLPDHLRV